MADSFFSLPHPAPVRIETHACPRCTSKAVGPTGKKPDASSYWRCDACGEVWSPARREAPAPRQRW